MATGHAHRRHSLIMTHDIMHVNTCCSYVVSRGKIVSSKKHSEQDIMAIAAA